jgi:hypothetical protein
MTRTPDSTNSGHPLLGDTLDIDSLIGTVDISPVPVKLAGKVWRVRRDHTANERFEIHRSLNADNGDDTPEGDEIRRQIWAAVLADPSGAAELRDIVQGLPQEQMNIAAHRLLAAANLIPLSKNPKFSGEPATSEADRAGE